MNVQLDTREIKQHLPNAISEVVDNRLCKMDQLFYPNALPDAVPRVTSVSLEGIDILRDNGAGYREGLHNYHHIRSHPSNDILITFPLASRVCQTQSGRVADFGRGSFSILSTTRPFRARISRPDQSDQPLAIMTRVATPLLRQKFPRIGECYGIPVKLRPGPPTIMRTLIEVALEEGKLLSTEQRRYLSRVLLDAVAESMLQMPEFEALNRRPQRATAQDLYEQAVFYIFNNIDNPDLGVSDVAGYCNVSTRHLRTVFSEFNPHTVVGFIREARLQRCQSDLKNQVLGDKPVASIASTWGFSDPAYFSRIYHDRFGRTPRQDRGT